MRYLKTSEAAALLNVSPNTLRAWERRFGFPRPQRSPGKHRLFTHGEVAENGSSGMRSSTGPGTIRRKLRPPSSLTASPVVLWYGAFPARRHQPL